MRETDGWAGIVLLFGAIFFTLLLSLGHCQTRVRQFPDLTIIRRGNFIIGATTDGYLCYGTHEPLETSCRRAIKLPEVINAEK